MISSGRESMTQSGTICPAAGNAAKEADGITLEFLKLLQDSVVDTVRRSSPGNLVPTSFPDRLDRQQLNDAYNDPSSGIQSHRKRVAQPKIAVPWPAPGWSWWPPTSPSGHRNTRSRRFAARGLLNWGRPG